MQYKGAIVVIMDEQKISEKFKKREFVLTDNAPSYPQTIIFEMNNDRCSLLDNFKEGDEVEIDFQLKGRKWTNPQGEVKYFNTAQAFRIFPVKTESGKSETPKPESAKQPQRQAPKKQEPAISPDPGDDLPF